MTDKKPGFLSKLRKSGTQMRKNNEIFITGLKMVSKDGTDTLTPESAWELIQLAFYNHPEVEVIQAEMRPNPPKSEKTSIHEQ